MKVVPAIDLREGRVVRLKQGRLEELTSYGPDPLAVAKRFAAEGATLLHVVDLDGAFDARPQFDLIERIIETAQIPVEVGGGIRAVETANRYVRAGAHRVIFGTAVIQDEGVVLEAMKRWPERVAIALDARQGIVHVSGWKRSTTTHVADLLPRLEALGARRIQYTDISRDGMLGGPDFVAIRDLAGRFKGNITVGGGVASQRDLDDLKAIAEASPNLDEVVVGRALYEGRITVFGGPGLWNEPTAELLRPQDAGENEPGA
jgi:phosphoribosylformimino-5-aminoimidazole carboxamide ribotide isomerase